MPLGVHVTILAKEHDTQPTNVATAMFATTMLSPLTLTPFC